MHAQAAGLPAEKLQDLAAEMLGLLGSGRQVAPFSARHPELTLADAYHVTALVRQLRAARGEKPVGRKIGFTNRTIWPQYGVYAPVWGYVFDSTVHDLAAGTALPLAAFAEPRIEPEIVFGLAAAPTPAMDDAALLACAAWVALGFEVVQSAFPEWKFAAADTVVANGVHGALLIGPRHPVAPRAEDWLRALPEFPIDLFCDGRLVDRGCAANVLDGPLSTLRHLAGLLAQDPFNPPLAAGEIVTTGTLTRAMPVAAGEIWTAVPSAIALDGIRLRFC